MEGSIVRIKLKNFVTYDAVEVRPGPNLNMIIGYEFIYSSKPLMNRPNGTGKSTIVCAIALGLAGRPDVRPSVFFIAHFSYRQVLGRAKHVKDFVKHGCETATIEVEIKKIPRNLVIHRTLNANLNSSSWLLNGKQISEKQIKEAISSLNIQIDNLW